MVARQAEVTRDVTAPLVLGINQRYRHAITLAPDKTGYPRASIAAVISAEAATLSGQRLVDATNQRFYDDLHPELKDLPFVLDKSLSQEWRATKTELSRMWDPMSFNKASGAGGLTQFLASSWADDIALREGSYLNKQAKSLGFIDGNNKILNRSALLDLRYDPTMSIVSAAELDKGYYMQLAARTRPDGTSLLPKNMTSDEQAKYIYLAHHEGANSAAQMLSDQLDERRALRLLQNHVPAESVRQNMIDANNGSSAAAYKNYLWQYINQRITPGKFR